MDDLAILVLYLPDRHDRIKSIRTELERMNLIDNATFIEGIRIVSHGSGAAGIAEGHVRCLEYAVLKKFKNVIILEDDCKFLVSPEVFRSEISSFLENASDWDGLWFGGFSTYDQDNIQHNFVRQISFNQDTATLINSHYYPKLIEYYKTCRDMFVETGQDKYVIDQFMNTEINGILPVRDDKLYTLVNRLCGQADCYSDRTFCVMNGGCNIPL
jgi:hypothetical protein